MDKNNVGRPRKYEYGEEPRVRTIRLTDFEHLDIVKKFGSLAKWIEHNKKRDGIKNKK